MVLAARVVNPETLFDEPDDLFLTNPARSHLPVERGNEFRSDLFIQGKHIGRVLVQSIVPLVRKDGGLLGPDRDEGTGPDSKDDGKSYVGPDKLWVHLIDRPVDHKVDGDPE